MNIYEELANKLLLQNLEGTNNIFIPFVKFRDGRIFGLKYRGYNGLMAKPKRGQMYVEKRKQGYFDVKVYTDNRYEEKYGFRSVTHYNVFQDLLENSSIENCMQIWVGEKYPWELTNNIEEAQALSSLLLLMFEQELNWGKEEWQKWSHFQPHIGFPNRRPRDMIMGFISMAFDLGGVDEIPDWIPSKDKYSIEAPSTPYFGKGGYFNYPIGYKKYFERLKNNGQAKPLMQGKLLEMFLKKSSCAPNNPRYKDTSKVKLQY